MNFTALHTTTMVTLSDDIHPNMLTVLLLVVRACALQSSSYARVCRATSGRSTVSSRARYHALDERCVQQMLEARQLS